MMVQLDSKKGKAKKTITIWECMQKSCLEISSCMRKVEDEEHVREMRVRKRQRDNGKETVWLRVTERQMIKKGEETIPRPVSEKGKLATHLSLWRTTRKKR